MDASTITTSTFTLVKQGTATPVAAAVTYAAATNTATLNPNADLESGATYTATVKGGVSGVSDASGNRLAADKAWTFVAEIDSTPPTVTRVSPAESATGVNASTKVSATFSEPMSASSISTSTFTLVRQGTTTRVAATVTYDAGTRTATLRPNAKLIAGATYTARIEAGPSGVKDSAGNALAVAKVWSFTVRR
jgi:hypothetical protein